MQTFKDQEAEYLQWLTENPSSYVANLDKRHSFRDYPLVHLASCGHLTRGGNFTTGDYYKVCAETLEELEEWCLQEHHKPLRVCVVCTPTRWTGFWWVNHKRLFAFKGVADF